MSIPISSASVFIQIWVDVNALHNGSTAGVYLVDNNVNGGSTNEGTTTLQTELSQGSNVCWSLLNIDPNSKAILSIASFSNSSAFGASGTPQQVTPTQWTGQVQAAGQAGYSITFNVQIPGASGITTTVSPSFNVTGAASTASRAPLHAAAS
ncbi:MAG TPA: hypothetical protein VF794_31705 [Archangium sp.]|jgi:hypothetical protein|uniref:hypothetical protein n=1 Tax=Archangium sp. TaxID=1872627 RepID=UPI002ED902DD